MLKLKLKSSDIISNIEELSISGLSFPFTYVDNEGVEGIAFSKEEIPEGSTDIAVYKDIIVVNCNEKHNLNDGESVEISRNDGSTISYSTSKIISVIDENRFYFSAFGTMTLNPVDVSSFYNVYYPGKPSKLLMVLYFHNNQHYFLKNRDGIVFAEDLSQDYLYTDESANLRNMKKRCKGDIVTYNTDYFYTASELTEVSGITKYVLDSHFLNTDDASITITNNFVMDDEVSGYTKDFIVPLAQNHVDDSLRLFYLADLEDSEELEFVDFVKENFAKLSFTCIDERFYAIDDSNIINIQDGTVIYAEKRKLDIHFPLMEQDSLNIVESGIFREDYAEKIKQEMINPIVDYEKQMFYPVYTTLEDYDKNNVKDEDLKDITKITFNIHLRERTESDEEWVLEDGATWNNYEISGKTLVNKISKELTVRNGDLIGHLGFDDEDVYYRKNRLKKSFIRLSFYDSPNRLTQTLLFYSTIFINTGDLYGKYIKLENMASDTTVAMTLNELVEGGDDKSLRLETTFSCTDKYNTESSSEGYYLYLYPNIVSGNSVSTIYMKVEIDNAKYGEAFALSMPVDDDYNPIEPTSEGFPYNYTIEEKEEGEEEGKYRANMERLHNDMYIRLDLKYDFSKKRYVYFLPRKYDSEELVFNLFEPRVNRANNKELCKGYGNNK